MPDPIGSASARLFAGGVDRRQRLMCLRFLGILLASADDEGHVHCDPDDLAGLGILHGMVPDEVDRSRVLLETFGILEREPTGWFIKQFAPVGDEVPPADVMAAIGRVLAKPAGQAVPAAPAAPAPAPAGAEPVVVPMETARTRLARRWMAAPVGAAAAAVVVVIALVASGQMRVPLTSRPASNSNQSAVGAGPGATTTVPGAPQSSSSAPAASPSPGATAAPSVGTTPSGTRATGVAAAAPAVCPTGNVSATVDHMGQQIDSSVPASSINADLPPVVRTSVSGVVRNTSPAAVLVNPFPVTVNFTDPAGQTSQSVTATALSGPTPIAPGASIPWSVTVQNPQQAPVPGTANAGQPTWRWDDAKLAAACPR